MLKGIQILLAEDDKLNQKIVGYILQKKGATVSMVTNGEQVIELLQRHHFDIVLMDLQMPLMGGYDTAKYIRTTLKSNVPIIAITADIIADEQGEYLKAGMNACICKPINPDHLCDLISELSKEQYVNF